MIDFQRMGQIQRIHFIGIGGAGMGGIAEVLLGEGYTITGSDVKASAMTQHLERLGAKVFCGHIAEQVEGADVVVVSSIIQSDNPEYRFAQVNRIPIVPRAMMLAELMRFRYGVAIAGTHGKTTTTSLMTSILTKAGLDPTFVIGGRLNSAGTNARLGSSRYLVVEADESDASFLYLHPMMAIVTNVDADHMSTYGGDFSRLRQAFIDFVHRLPFYGVAVVCLDDAPLREMIPEFSRRTITYGWHEDADYRAKDYVQSGFQASFTLQRKKRPDRRITLNLPGQHNIQNALSAIAVAEEIGVEIDTIASALEEFQGVGRRSQILGEFTIRPNETVMLIDDYGHHPREVEVTLRAIQNAWPDRRLVMVFQPHRYSRTQDLFDDFCKVLSEVSTLCLMEIYPAYEKPIAGIDSHALCRNIRQRGKVDPIYVENETALQEILPSVLRGGDILLLQGAGDIGGIASRLAASGLMFE